MTIDIRTFRELCEVIGSIDAEIQKINDHDEDLKVSDATQILAELEDRIVSVAYLGAQRDSKGKTMPDKGS